MDNAVKTYRVYDPSIDAEKMESMRIRSLHPNKAMSVKDTIKIIKSQGMTTG